MFTSLVLWGLTSFVGSLGWFVQHAILEPLGWLVNILFVAPGHWIWGKITYLTIGGMTVEENTIIWGNFVSSFIASILKHFLWFFLLLFFGVFFVERWNLKKGGLKLIPILKPSEEYGVVLGTLDDHEQTLKNIKIELEAVRKKDSTLGWGIACIGPGVRPEIFSGGSNLLVETIALDNAKRLHTTNTFVLIFQGTTPTRIVRLIEHIEGILSIKGTSVRPGAAVVLRVRKFPIFRNLLRAKNPYDHIVTLIGYQDGEQFEHLGY